MKFGLQNVKLLAKYYDQNICKKMLQWCPLLNWPYLSQYVILCNNIYIAGKPRCIAFQQCLRHCIWFSIYGDMDQSIHIATSLQHFFCLLYTVTQKRVHMFYKVRKIGPYLHTYWMNLDDLNCAGKVCITAFWQYLIYDVILYICWDNPIIVQCHMWTLFLLLNFMYYLLDYSTKSSSNLIKLCMRIYTYHFYTSVNFQVILFIYNREI